MKYVIQTDTEGSLGRIYWTDLQVPVGPVGAHTRIQHTARLFEALVFDSEVDALQELIEAAKSKFEGYEVAEITERELFEARLKGEQ